jgi:hypothetical protein
MARYRVQGPDGALHELEGPEDATPAQIEAAAAQMIPAGAKVPAPIAPAAQMPRPDPSAGGSTLNIAGFDTGVKTPEWLDRTLAGAGKSAASTVRGVGQMLGMVPQADVDETARLDKPLMDTTAGTMGNVGGAVAQMVVPASVVGKIAPAVNAVTKARPFLSAAASGGLFAGAQPVVTGDDRAIEAAKGAAAGLVGQGVASGVARLARGASDLLEPAVRTLYEKAQAAGIPVTLAQLSDSTFVKTLASALGKLPGSGAQARAGAQSDALGTAVSKTFGENSPRIDADLYAAAKKRIGASFEDLTSRNDLSPSPKMLMDLGAVSSDATRFGATDTARAIGNAIDEIVGKIDPATGVIPGKAYQAFDSAMGKLTKSGDEKAHYIGQLRDIVRSAMDSSISPADSAAWQMARSQYKNLKTIRDLVAKDTGEGVIPPKQLMGRVTATNAGKEAMAMGNGGEMGDLAQIAKRFLGDYTPDSGTALRNLIYGAGGAAVGGGAVATGHATPSEGAGIGVGTLLLGLLAGRGGSAALSSRALANYGARGLPGGQALEALARPAPALLPAFAATPELWAPPMLIRGNAGR